MIKYSIFFLTIIFLMGCQSKHLVTHNKRKYTKGYHIPKHKKVSHKGNSKSKNIAKSTARNSVKAERITVIETTNHKKVNEEVETNVYSVDEKSERFVEDSPRKNTEIEATTIVQNKVVEKEKTEKKERRHNWRYWLSIAFLPIGAILLLGSLIALIMNFWLLVALVVVFLSLMIFGIIINVKNMKLTKDDKNQVFLRRSSIIFVILFSFFFALIFVLFFVLGLDSF